MGQFVGGAGKLGLGALQFGDVSNHFAGEWVQWVRLVSRLQPRYRVLAPDLIGYGSSDPWPDPDHFDLDADTAVISALLAREGAAHLVGHSYGGMLALRAATRDPSRVLSLSLFEPVAFGVLYSAGRTAGIADLTEPERVALFLDGETGGDERWMRAFIDYWNGAGAFDALPAGRRAALLATGRKSFLEVRALLLDRTPHTDYAGIGCPALLLTGTRSPVAAREVIDVLAAALPAARVEVLEGAGHMAPIAQGDRVNALIEAHLPAAGR